MWPTPNVPNGGRTLAPETSDTGITADGKKRQVGLENMVKRVEERQMWPTPRYEGFDAGAHRGEPDSLHSAVKMLHTPTSKANQLSPTCLRTRLGSRHPPRD
jgi:hypothetical protein